MYRQNYNTQFDYSSVMELFFVPHYMIVFEYKVSCWMSMYVHTLLISMSIVSYKAFFFYQKALIFFLFLHENLCCGYSLEVPHWGTSNEYPQHRFSWRHKSIFWIPLLSGAMYVHLCFFILFLVFNGFTIATDKALFSSKKCWYFSYFSMKTYVVVLIRSASARRFWWVPTTYVFMEK